MKLSNNEETLPLSFAEVICDKICSGHNQHDIIMFEGKTGMGKSNAAIDLAYTTSLVMAYRLGGRPEDYFTIENIAVLTAEEAFRITKNIKQHGIYILDDVAAEAFSARNWNKKDSSNEILAKIIQTFRTKENLLIITVPDRDFVDKIGRNILHYKVVMNRAWFGKGLTLGKLSTVQKMYNKDNSYNMYPFIRHGRTVYNFAVFHKPPEHLRVPYEEKRKRIEEEMRISSIEKHEEKDKVNQKEKKIPKYIAIIPEVQKLKNENPKISNRKVGEIIGCDVGTVGKALKHIKSQS